MNAMSFYEGSLLSVAPNWLFRLLYMATYIFCYFFLLTLLVWLFYKEKLTSYIKITHSQNLHFILLAILLPILMITLWILFLPGAQTVKTFSIWKYLYLAGITLLEYGFMITFIEEFTFRVLLQPKIASAWGRKTAVISTSLLWSILAFHSADATVPYVLWDLLLMTLWGMFFSYIYNKTGSFTVCMLFHGMLNILWNGQILSISTYFWSGNESILEYKIPELSGIFYRICNPEHYETNALILLISFFAWKAYFHRKEVREPSA